MFLFTKIAFFIVFFILIAAMVALSIAPERPPSLASINEQARQVDVSGLPPQQFATARDGSHLAFRRYNSGGSPFVLLIHGSAGSSIAVHPLAMALAARGADIVSPDIRGHGGSGPQGDIPFSSDLIADVADLLDGLAPTSQAQRILVGHSSGGGFVLRVNATEEGQRFQRAILLAPYLGWDAPSSGPGNSAWARASIPRMIALTTLGQFGLRWLGQLTVLTFATPTGIDHVTDAYSFRLFDQFRTRDARADFAKAHNPVDIIVGEADELMVPSAYAPLAAGQPAKGSVILMNGVGHMQLVMQPTVANSVAEHILQLAALRPALTSRE